MPYQMNCLPLGVYTIYHGTLTQSEFFDSLDALHHHPNFSHFRFSVRDLRFCKPEHLSNNADLALASRFLAARMVNPHIYSAILVEDAEVRQTAQRLKDLAPKMLELFDAPEEASRWLQLMTGMPPECLPQAHPSNHWSSGHPQAPHLHSLTVL